MKADVKFSRIVQMRAGRKNPQSKGFQLDDEGWYSDSNKNIVIHNVNNKDGNLTTDLHICIPKENIEDVITALKKFL